MMWPDITVMLLHECHEKEAATKDLSEAIERVVDSVIVILIHG